MARAPTPPSNLRQDTFISSTEVRTSYIKPFGTRHYFAFIKDPRWPPAFIDNGGVRLYVREKIDEFLRRIAAEGFEPGAGYEAPQQHFENKEGSAADVVEARQAPRASEAPRRASGGRPTMTRLEEKIQWPGPDKLKPLADRPTRRRSPARA